MIVLYILGHEIFDAVMLAGMLNRAPPDPNVSEDVAGDSSQNKMETPLDTEQKAHIQVLPQPAETQIFGTDTDSSQRWDKYCFRSTGCEESVVLGCDRALKGEWLLPFEGMCADGSTVFIGNVRSHSPNKEHRNPEDLRPYKQCCENIESHTVNLRPSFNIRPGHVQIVAHGGTLGQFVLLSIILPVLHTHLLTESFMHLFIHLSQTLHNCKDWPYITQLLSILPLLCQHSQVQALTAPNCAVTFLQFSARVIFNEIGFPAPTPNLEDKGQQLACCQENFQFPDTQKPLSCQNSLLIKYDISMCLSVSDSVNFICSGLSYINSNLFLVVGLQIWGVGSLKE